MAALTFSLLFLLFPLSLSDPRASAPTAETTAVYLSKPTLHSNYQKMQTNLKIFVYPPQIPFNYTTPSLSFFYFSLLSSPFITQDPNEANLFFLPFPPQSTRSLTRVIANIRSSYPYWDRALGADHFYLACDGVGFSSSRNVVELKKNAIQISCFGSPPGGFIPHKDITLPGLSNASLALPHAPRGMTGEEGYLGYWRWDQVHAESDLIRRLAADPEFLIESEPSDEAAYVDKLQKSKFCFFIYGGEAVARVGMALAHGCVPVVITDRPIQDLPLMDVIRWSEIALFVGEQRVALVVKEARGEKYERMRRLGVAAAQHLQWNEPPQQYDAFYMVLYQLWVRRHAIRYSRSDV